MIPAWIGNGKKAGGDLAGLMLTTEAMIADILSEPRAVATGFSFGGMGGMGMGMGM